MQTIPTMLTQKQYSQAKIAYVRKGEKKGDMWLLSEALPSSCLWLGNDLRGLADTKDQHRQNTNGVEKTDIYVFDENGCEVCLPMLTFPAGNGLYDLDLEALAQGQIDWN